MQTDANHLTPLARFNYAFSKIVEMHEALKSCKDESVATQLKNEQQQWVTDFRVSLKEICRIADER